MTTFVNVDTILGTGVTSDRQRALIETTSSDGEMTTISIDRSAAVEFFIAAADVFGRRFVHDERHPQHLLPIDRFAVGRTTDGRVVAVLRMGDVELPLALSYHRAAQLAEALHEITGPVQPRVEDEIRPLLEPGSTLRTK